MTFAEATFCTRAPRHGSGAISAPPPRGLRFLSFFFFFFLVVLPAAPPRLGGEPSERRIGELTRACAATPPHTSRGK